jgi:hypothetical protein
MNRQTNTTPKTLFTGFVAQEVSKPILNLPDRLVRTRT